MAKPPKSAKIKPAKGREVAGQNNTGKINKKTAPAPKGAPTNPPRPDVANFEHYRESLKTPQDIKNEWSRLGPELSQAQKDKNYVRATQLKDAQAALIEKANALGMSPKDLPTFTPMPADQAEIIGGMLGGGDEPLGGALRSRAMRAVRNARTRNGGYVMKRRKVGCFTAGKKTKNKTSEYDQQLKDQEQGLNNMTVQEYLDGRKKFGEIGRKGTGAAQEAARAEYSKVLNRENIKNLNKSGIFGKPADEQAAAMTASTMKSLAALHSPDMIAGGKDVISGMGDRGVNSSIGGQWKDRIKDLDNAANAVPENERKMTKMNVKLERCP